MRTTIVNCDLCKAVIPENKGWENEPRPLFIETHCTSQNPLAWVAGSAQIAKLHFQDVCQDCHRSISDTLSKKIRERMNRYAKQVCSHCGLDEQVCACDETDRA